MSEGVIKWYDEKKGFGFIGRGPHEDDLWFHCRDRAGGVNEAQLVQGAQVRFEICGSVRGPKGLITLVLSGEPAQEAPEASQYTFDEALAGLSEALLGAAEWLDIIQGLRKAGRA
jgi:cold shock CspA family protein